MSAAPKSSSHRCWNPQLDRIDRLAMILPDIHEAAYRKLSNTLYQEAQYHLEFIRQEISDHYKHTHGTELPPALSLARECAALSAHRACLQRLTADLCERIIEHEQS